MQSMSDAPQAVLEGMTAGFTGGMGSSGMSSNITNSNTTNNNWNVTIPTAGGGQPIDQMQSAFNTLTTLYAS
jgi:hypothetical protein